jgi:hypothetical protein
MSHRVTTQSEIKDKALALAAAKSAGVSVVEEGEHTLRFTSGPLSRATLDLRTGTINGDTDYGHTNERFGVLKQHYSEAKYKLECARQGIMVESRSVDEHGNIVLYCAMG